MSENRRPSPDDDSLLGRLQQARAAVPPTVLTDEDGLVEVEISAALEVTRLSLSPRAGRDLPALETALQDTLTRAIAQARAAADEAVRVEIADRTPGLEQIMTDVSARAQERRDASAQRVQLMRARIESARSTPRITPPPSSGPLG